MPETDQSSINVYKTRDLQIASVATSTATKSFSMAHKMGLIQINMKKATAPETRTYTANSVSTAYDSGNVEFYALNVFDGTNLPYSATCPGTVSYFIVKYSSGNYSFTTPYKVLNNGSTTGAVSQWTMPAVTAPASGKCTSATTSDPIFKNLGRLYSYTESSQTYTPMLTGFKYKMECWGASGGSGWLYNGGNTWAGGNGAYCSGIIKLEKLSDLYVYVGQAGYNQTGLTLSRTSYNGGGYSDSRSSSNDGAGGGGGATDIRLTNGNWDSFTSLKSRIIVAGGGGGGASTYTTSVTNDMTGCHAGGINVTGQMTSWSQGPYNVTTVTQTNGNAFGVGANGRSNGHFGDGGGGGGYYGGIHVFPTSSDANYYGKASGGTCYISGHSGCNAIKETATAGGESNHTGSPNHYSNYVFSYSTTMIDGRGYKWTNVPNTSSNVYAPNPLAGTGNESTFGHSGNGYARITFTPYE